jgi:hypothetical protein
VLFFSLPPLAVRVMSTPTLPLPPEATRGVDTRASGRARASSASASRTMCASSAASFSRSRASVSYTAASARARADRSVSSARASSAMLRLELLAGPGEEGGEMSSEEGMAGRLNGCVTARRDEAAVALLRAGERSCAAPAGSGVVGLVTRMPNAAE